MSKDSFKAQSCSHTIAHAQKNGDKVATQSVYDGKPRQLLASHIIDFYISYMISLELS